VKVPCGGHPIHEKRWERTRIKVSASQKRKRGKVSTLNKRKFSHQTFLRNVKGGRTDRDETGRRVVQGKYKVRPEPRPLS